MEWLLNFDHETFLTLHHYWRSSWGDVFFDMFSGRFVWIPMYVVMVYVLFRDFKWQQAVVALLAVAATIALTDQIGAQLIRPLVQRPRPSSVASPVVHLASLTGEMRSATAYGFPSCHAANTMALALLFSLFIKRWWITVFLFLWAIVTCYSRIYLAAHYPGDLLAGSLLGLIIAGAVYLMYRGVVVIWIGSRYKPREYRGKLNLPGITTTVYPSILIPATGFLTIIYFILCCPIF